ncbi:MAG: BREX-3 system phosphatase PglZ [Armatimonadetes bacterium]|nr:BREX-3 system phosphatase PglZ [Armatimonadota bacterium]
MSSWRDEILKEFTPNVAPLTLVADPDGLLLEERMLDTIRERGFELIVFKDSIEFRYVYESKFRSRWDEGESIDLVVVVQSEASELKSLPYDLFKVDRKFSFNLAGIFPHLSYRVVTALDRADLDDLYEAQKRHAPGDLGDNATKEFVLHHVFKITPDLIEKPSDLLQVLLRRHYRGQRIPRILDERFIQLLRQCGTFNDWPLETIVPDREAFFAFLQERWPVFLDREAAKDSPRSPEIEERHDFSIHGPAHLPFDHDEVHVYIDNLFLEGFLQPVPHKHAGDYAKSWTAIGIQVDEHSDRLHRIGKLLDRLKTSVPAEDARYGDWLHFARACAELVVLSCESPEQSSGSSEKGLRDLRQVVDDRFAAWIAKRYASLDSLPPVPPVMLHQIPRYLSRQLEQKPKAKAALVVIDGLSMDQWLVVRNTLQSKTTGLLFREQAVFAWIPSLTSISRQAIFAGDRPFNFPSSVWTTDKEPTLWMRFWTGEGLASSQIIYRKSLGDGSLEALSEELSHPRAKVAGLVVDKVDKIMHGMALGTAGMHNQVRQWTAQGYLSDLLDLLFKHEFQVYLTSDHGNVEAEGCGRPTEKSLANFRGERVRVYPDVSLRRLVKDRFPDAIEWDPVGIPEDFFSLLAPHRRAFLPESQRTVTHGGASLEEIVVPLVQVERKLA